MQKVLCLLGSLLLIGCSNQAQLTALAEQNDWQQIGEIDGQSGHYQRGEVELAELSSLSEGAYYQYKVGYLAGIENYCQPDRAFQHGLDGNLYRGQCANTGNEAQAIEQWKQGYDTYMMDTAFINDD